MNSLPNSANTKAELWNQYKVVITECEEILAVLGDMHLPETKPRVLELTDAGPGVGCSNGAVQYRMAETILVHGLDKVVRVHRAREDSGQNSIDNDTVANVETVRGNQVSSPFAQMNMLPCSISENVSSSISVPSSSV